MTEAEKIAGEWLVEKTQEADSEISEADVVDLINLAAARTREACLQAVHPLTIIWQVDTAIRHAKWERDLI